MASINEALTCADGDATTPPHHVIDIENESAVDNQSQDVIIVEEDDGEDGMKTPKRQTALQKKLQQVFDLSRKSSEATYQWMRCGFYFFMHALCVTVYLNFLCSCCVHWQIQQTGDKSHDLRRGQFCNAESIVQRHTTAKHCEPAHHLKKTASANQW